MPEEGEGVESFGSFLFCFFLGPTVEVSIVYRRARTNGREETNIRARNQGDSHASRHGGKKTKTKTNSSNSLRFNFVRETQYLLNFTKSNVIQTCHDRDWVKLNKKLDTRPNFTKFHTTRDRNE